MKQYKPEFFGVLLALLLLNVWYLSGLAIESSSLSLGFDHMFNVIEVSIGSLTGALFAFSLAKNQAYKAKIDDDVAIINKVLIHITLQLNVIKNIELQLHRKKNEHERAFRMGAEKNYDENVLFNISELTSVLEHDPQIILELHIEQAGFLATVESLKNRNAFYLDRLLPAMIEKKLVGGSVNLSAFEAHLPSDLYHGAYQSIENIEENIVKSTEGLNRGFEKLREVGRKRYPNQNFLSMKT